MNNPDTNTIQHWMKSVLVKRGNLQEKLFFAGKEFSIDANELVIGTEKVPVETRIGIYTTGYMLRLLECMEADLPSLHTYLGEDLFVIFAKGFLLEQPSKSFSLYDLTRGFADFLDRTRPRNPEMDEYMNAQYDLPAELVRLERARLEAMRSKGTEGIPVKNETELFGFLSGKETRLQTHPCLQLLQQKIPLVHFYKRLLHGEKPEMPEPAESFVAVTRMNFNLQFHELLSWQYYLLSDLQNSTEPKMLSELLASVSEKSKIPVSQLIAETGFWLPVAIDMGCIVETDS